MSDNDRPDPEFEEPRDGETRATMLVDERGGVPEDNPFADVVRQLRAQGESWSDIYDTLQEVAPLLDDAALEEQCELIPEWRVAAVVPDEKATSGERYEFHERTAETAEAAEESVEKATGFRVAPEKTEQIGVGRYA